MLPSFQRSSLGCIDANLCKKNIVQPSVDNLTYKMHIPLCRSGLNISANPSRNFGSFLLLTPTKACFFSNIDHFPTNMESLLVSQNDDILSKFHAVLYDTKKKSLKMSIVHRTSEILRNLAKFPNTSRMK